MSSYKNQDNTDDWGSMCEVYFGKIPAHASVLGEDTSISVKSALLAKPQIHNDIINMAELSVVLKLARSRCGFTYPVNFYSDIKRPRYVNISGYTRYISLYMKCHQSNMQ